MFITKINNKLIKTQQAQMNNIDKDEFTYFPELKKIILNQLNLLNIYLKIII